MKRMWIYVYYEEEEFGPFESSQSAMKWIKEYTEGYFTNKKLLSTSKPFEAEVTVKIPFGETKVFRIKELVF